MRPTREQAYEALTDEWRSTTEIARSIGVEPKALGQLLRRMERDGHCERRVREELVRPVHEWRRTGLAPIPHRRRRRTAVTWFVDSEWRSAGEVAGLAGVSRQQALFVLNRMKDEGEAESRKRDWRTLEWRRIP